MIRFNDLADLLYFKGKISNKHISLNEVYDKENNENFTILVLNEVYDKENNENFTILVSIIK